MKQALEQSRTALISLACLLVGWIWVGLFLASGMPARYPAAWWVKAAAFCCFVFSPIAVLLAAAGLKLDERKTIALVALVLSLLSAGVIFVISP